MTLKSLVLGAAAASLFASAAFAQTDNTQTNSVDPLQDKTLMGQFYTDDSMQTLRSQDEMKAALDSMKSEDRDRVRAACANNVSPRDTFCEGLKSIEMQ